MEKKIEEKESEKIDPRQKRVWYLLHRGKKIANNEFDDWELISNNWINVTKWKDITRKSWNTVKNTPYIFLSRAPLTFGHSQLVIPSRSGDYTNEEDFFKWASIIIQRAIIVLRKAFDQNKKNPLHEEEDFRLLAFLTNTHGKYIKTLILRSSADEDVGKVYKIHLVPYFKSHESDCTKRFKALHPYSQSERGGLLGWLGERENEVDIWEVDRTYWKDKLDSIANYDLKMSKLAKKLHEIWSAYVDKTIKMAE